MKNFVSLLSIFLLCTLVDAKNLKFSDEINAFIKEHNIKVVDFDYAKKALQNKKAIFVDARIAKRYNTKTIRTSINIPLRNFKKFIGQLKNISKSKEIIVFCDGTACNKSTRVALKLIKNGYKNTKVYQGGMPEWEVKDYSKINKYYMKRLLKDPYSFSVLDLRNKKDFDKSHIKHSISIKYDKNLDFSGKIPINKLTPIVIISKKGDKQTHEIAKKLVSIGYSNIGIYEDGYNTWEKLKIREIKKLKNVKKKFEPYLGPIKKGKDEGTVDGKWFIKNYKHLPKKITLIDVRGKSERKKGFLRGSKHISLGENSPKEFMSKLPKDRYIIFYCHRGNRSFDAYEIVKNSGFSWADKVLYLDAIVNCKRLKCTITPNEPTNPTIW